MLQSMYISGFIPRDSKDTPAHAQLQEQLLECTKLYIASDYYCANEIKKAASEEFLWILQYLTFYLFERYHPQTMQAILKMIYENPIENQGQGIRGIIAKIMRSHTHRFAGVELQSISREYDALAIDISHLLLDQKFYQVKRMCAECECLWPKLNYSETRCHFCNHCEWKVVVASGRFA